MKLHLPKVLFAAVIAAAACFQQVQATEYYVLNAAATFHGSTFKTTQGEDGKTPTVMGDAGTNDWRAFSNVTNVTPSIGDHTLM